jgi:SAM-dependent methyltransferase
MSGMIAFIRTWWFVRVKSYKIVFPQPRELLQISKREIQEAVLANLPSGSLCKVIVCHAWTTWVLARQGIRYRSTGISALHAYQRMSVKQLNVINGRQKWANWRTIPRSLNGRMRNHHPLLMVDLCCGVGDSTSALAWWLPKGSRIIAIEYDQRFAAIAAEKVYKNRHDEVISVQVNCASVTDQWRDYDGAVINQASIHAVHAIGSIGSLFTYAEVQKIVQQAHRILVDHGWAFLDAGMHGISFMDLRDIARQEQFNLHVYSRSWIGEKSMQLCLQKSS